MKYSMCIYQLVLLYILVFHGYDYYLYSFFLFYLEVGENELGAILP